MICSSLFCLQNQSRLEKLVNPSRARTYSALCGAQQTKSDQSPSQQLLQLRNQQLSSISSIQSKSRHSSSNSTMVNSEEVESNRAKMHIKRFSDKISISDLRKANTMKRMPALSTSSSVQKISFISQTNSIIDKLQGLQMEGKTVDIQNKNTGEADKDLNAEIYLPKPKHFLMKWKKL